MAINFEPVVGEILEKVDDGQMGVVLKRMMVRAASKVAERYGVQALVTGEALGGLQSDSHQPAPDRQRLRYPDPASADFA